MRTVETVRLTYFLDSFIKNRHYAMFVGNTGTSKTAIMMNKLKNMDPEVCSSFVINMNSFSDAPSLQPVIEAPLEKKSGMRFGPPGNKNLVRRCQCTTVPHASRLGPSKCADMHAHRLTTLSSPSLTLEPPRSTSSTT